MWKQLSQWLLGADDAAEVDGTGQSPRLSAKAQAAAAHAPGALRPFDDRDTPKAPAGGFDTRGLLGKALDERQLLEAWERVRDNDGAAGVDGQDVQAFGTNLLGRLQQLRSEVLHGHYQPQPLKRVSIPKGPKDSGQVRWLAIPSVRDRVLQTAVAQVLRPLMEREFEDASYGYRNGRSVAMAIARVARHRDAGLVHVLDADIEGFFDHIHHDTLLRQFRETVRDAGLQAIVALWLSAVVREGKHSYLLTRGVPQGSPLSPMLANLYLDDLDEAVLAKFPGLVRYADDFVVLCRTPEQAQQAHALVQGVLGDLRLKFNPAKTRLTDFDAGFIFLGVHFRQRLMEPVDPAAEPWLLPDRADERAVARHEVNQALQAVARGVPLDQEPAPPPLPRSDTPAEAAPHRLLTPSADPGLDLGTDHDGPDTHAEPPLVRLSAEPVAAPLLQSLYVGEHGVWLTKEGERVTVSRDREVLASVPLGQLDQIAVFSNAMVSTALMRHCAELRIAVYLGDATGGAGATLDRGALPDLELFDLQRRRHRHDGFNTHLARSYIEGKVHNAKVVLRRFTRREGREAIDEVLRRLDDCLGRLPGAPDCATLRGLEGAAARAYFEAFRTLLPPEIGFGGRRRRPPTDPTNALLSFGYAVLASNLQALLRLAGLNVHFGALHATGAGSQALVSDLMEEFRAPVVDSVVLTLLREGSIGHADFDHDPGGELPLRLKRDARKRFVQALELKLETRFIHPRYKKVMDMRRAMQAQAHHYIRVLRREEAVYVPLKFK